VRKATTFSPHDLALLVFTCNYNFQAAQYLKNKIDKDNFRKKNKKNHVGKNTVAIHSNLRGKL